MNGTGAGALSSKRLYLPLTFLIVFFILLLNLAYQNIDNVQLDLSDSHWHLKKAAATYKSLASSGIAGYLQDHPSEFYHPPLVYLVTAPFFHFGGVSLNSAFISQWIFWIILAMSAYFLGCKIAGPEGGFLGALMIMGIPYLGKCGRDYCLDLPLSAMVALAFTLLIYSDSFKSPVHSWAFFVISALGAFTKALFPFYLSIPFASVFLPLILNRIKSADDSSKKPLTGCLLFVFAVIAAAYLNGAFVFRTVFPGESQRFLCWICAASSSAGFFILGAKKIHSLEDETGAPLKRCLYGILTSSAILWPYYGFHFNEVFSQTALLASAGKGPLNLLLTLNHLVFSTFGLLFIGFICIGLFMLTARSPAKREPLIFISALSFIGGILLIIILPVKDNRFFLPLAIFALPLSLGILPLTKGFSKAMAVFAICYFSLMGAVGWTVRDTPLMAPLGALMEIDRGRTPLGRPYALFTPPPSTDGFDREGIFRCIRMITQAKSWTLVICAESENEAYALSRGIQISALLSEGMGIRGVEGLVPKPDPAGKDRFTCLHMALENIRTERDALMPVLILESAKNSRMLPDVLRESLLKRNENYRPDLNMVLKEEMINGRSMRMRLLRISPHR